MDRFHQQSALGNFDKYPYNFVYQEWIASAPRSFEITCNLSDADVAVIPFDLNGKLTAQNRAGVDLAVNKAKTEGVRVIGFAYGDDELCEGFQDVCVYTLATSRRKRTANIHTFPAWGADILEKYRDGRLPTLEQRASRPTVSFCGNGFAAANNRLAKLNRWLRLRIKSFKNGSKHPDIHPRAKAIEDLLASSEIESKFHLKFEGWRGFTFLNTPDSAALENDQALFAQNLLSATYALCVRGNGNFSFRLYEVISSGRIPVFIDTDSLLPLHEQLPWRDLMVWVDEGASPTACLLEHFRTHSADEIRAQQAQLLEVWRTRLRPECFFAEILLLSH